MPPTKLPLLAFFALVALFGLVLLATMERRMIYFPVRALDAKPSDFGLQAEDLRLETEDGVRLHAWWIKSEGKHAVLFFHGNAGNISHRLERARLFVQNLGTDLLLLDYRGYGRSEGRPSEAGLFRDARAAYEAAIGRQWRPDQILLFGESLGSSVALQLALDRPCAGVILETPFLSVPALARKYYPFVPGFVIRDRFDNEKKIARLSVPKLIIAAGDDEIVPLSHARRLFDLAPPPKELFVIPGAGHNDTYVVGGQPYIEAWRRFLAAAAPISSSVPFQGGAAVTHD